MRMGTGELIMARRMCAACTSPRLVFIIVCFSITFIILATAWLPGKIGQQCYLKWKTGYIGSLYTGLLYIGSPYVGALFIGPIYIGLYIYRAPITGLHIGPYKWALYI